MNGQTNKHETKVQREERLRKEKKAQRTGILITCFLIIILFTVVGFCIKTILGKKKDPDSKDSPVNASVSEADETNPKTQESDTQAPDEKASILDKANRLAAGYDYDKAIELVKSWPGYENDADMASAISSFEAAKGTMVRYEDPSTITHIFFHSLIVDTSKAFDGDDMQDGYNEVMTTVDEFNKIIQQMYDRGYVLVSIHDMVKETTDENGNVTMQPGDIYLPAGKKPFVLSQDDVSYYEYMEGDGFATKIILQENGRPTCEMKMDDGTVAVGDFDMVPLLETFIEAHPDFSYRGARGILALTGYNGVLGYRTDEEEYGNLPDYQQQVEDATRVAQGLRDWGWEFASHTWGHIHMSTVDMERFKTDTDKWENRVETIIGETDILIFPFGEDVGSWHPYASDNERVNYLKSVGFHVFCNVDSAQHWVQFGDDYMRQGRRNLDGTRMYWDMMEGTDKCSDLFDVQSVFDPARPTPVPKL